MSSPSKNIRLIRWGVAPLATAFVVAALWQPASGQGQPPAAAGAPAGDQNGAEVLTRGPIHEAFGQPTVFNPKPGLAIPKNPPQAIEELPPEEKPEGENVAWIGGYWSWDDDKKDFLWVSGFWRVLPPNRQWMPGYWNDAGGQYQWVSGYWASAEMKEQEFIAEAPPASLEQGAPPTAPSEDHLWVPGTWVHHTSRYMWRPGYWIGNQSGWVWIPASYYWTPSGYVFVDGYWDWSLRRRGVLFAPVYFDQAVIVRPGYYYRPSICLDVEVITPHFFCRPTYGHYYFGDYYASSYLSVGITPWFHAHYSRGAGYYSGDFVYYSAYYRRADPQWSINIRLGYERCRDHVHHRPPRTYIQQTTIINKTTIVNNNTTINNNKIVMAKPLKEVSAASAKSGDAPMKFQKISDNQARQFGKTATEARQVGQQRIAMEKAAVPGGGAGRTVNTAKDGGVRKVALPRSPLVSKATPATEGSGKPSVGGIASRPGNVPPPIPGAARAGAVTDNKAGNTGVTGRGTVPGKPDTGAAGGADKSARTLPGTDKGSTGGVTGTDRPTRPLPGGTPDKGSTGTAAGGDRPPRPIAGGSNDKAGAATGGDRPTRPLPGGLPDRGTSGAGDTGKSGRLPPVVPRERDTGGSSTKPGGVSGSGRPTPPPSSGSSRGSSSGSSSKDKDKGSDKSKDKKDR